jgi:hypothetical protein
MIKLIAMIRILVPMIPAILLLDVYTLLTHVTIMMHVPMIPAIVKLDANTPLLFVMIRIFVQMTNVLKDAVILLPLIATTTMHVPMTLVVKKPVNVNTLHTFAMITTNVPKIIVTPLADVPSLM